MRLGNLLLMAFAAYSAASFAKYEPSPSNKMEAKGVMTMTVAWIKDKSKKFDLKLTIRNDNDKSGIIVFLHDMGCQRGGTTGSLKHTFFNTGERTIDFRPNQQKSFNMVCDLPGKSSGPFKITVAKVYENANLDGKTSGKVLATDLTWSQDDRN